MRVFVFILFVLAIPASLAENPKVTIKTTAGDIEVLLYADRAPITVSNFLSYVDSDAHDKIIFHRVIAGFMIQTGGYYADLQEAEEGETILNEADNGLKNLRGTLSMARMNEIDSAGRQFFINASDNASLDHSDESCTREDEKSVAAARAKGMYKPVTCRTFGYAVFGEVVSGMDVVADIELVDTEPRGGHGDVPITPVYILSIERSEAEAIHILR